jgi:hypothetical protein
MKLSNSQQTNPCKTYFLFMIISSFSSPGILRMLRARIPSLNLTFRQSALNTPCSKLKQLVTLLLLTKLYPAR